jgi:hypothetical protein
MGLLNTPLRSAPDKKMVLQAAPWAQVRPWENLYSIAPVPGAWSAPAHTVRSPYNRGEWSTDILPHPLRQTWTGAKELASDLSILILDQPLIWYLNTPETEANFPIVKVALAKLGYSAARFPIQEPRYAFARFGLLGILATGLEFPRFTARRSGYRSFPS